jgi:hypothetical protein
VVRKAPRTDGGYVLFNPVRYGNAWLIMVPAAFCAGMTLRLVTRILYSPKGRGEREIGVVCTANTIGAILGLAFAINAALSVFGVEYAVASGARSTSCSAPRSTSRLGTIVLELALEILRVLSPSAAPLVRMRQ